MGNILQNNGNTDDDPFGSDSDSTEDIRIFEKNEQPSKNNQLVDDTNKSRLPSNPTVVQLNKKLISDVQNLSIHDDGRHNDTNYDPSFDMLNLENESAFGMELAEESTKSIYKDDMVYLSNIYNIFEKVNSKIDDLVNSRFVSKQCIDEIHRNALENDLNSVIKNTKSILNKKDISNIAYGSLLSVIEEFPSIVKELEDGFKEIKTVKKEYELCFENVIDNVKCTSEVLKGFNDNLTKKIRDFILVFNAINTNYQLLIDKKENKGVSAFESEEIDSFLNSLVDNFIKIDNENKKLKDDFEKLKNDKDLNSMNKTIETNKKTIKGLQEENVAFSDAVNKLNEINIKLKKECVLISSEYKKLVDINKERKRTIEKQKKLIELLQNKLGENSNDPLSEIKSKMITLKHEIDKESDSKKKEQLLRNYEDTEKRLKDFETVYNKH